MWLALFAQEDQILNAQAVTQDTSCSLLRTLALYPVLQDTTQTQQPKLVPHATNHALIAQVDQILNVQPVSPDSIFNLNQQHAPLTALLQATMKTTPLTPVQIVMCLALFVPNRQILIAQVVAKDITCNPLPPSAFRRALTAIMKSYQRVLVLLVIHHAQFAQEKQILNA